MRCIDSNYLQIWSKVNKILTLLIVHIILHGNKNIILLNTLRPEQNSAHFVDDNINWIFFNENDFILLYMSL